MKPMTPVMSAKIAMTIFEIMTFSSTASTMVTMVAIQYSLYSQLSSLLMTAHHQVPLLSPLVHSTGSPISAWTCAS